MEYIEKKKKTKTPLLEYLKYLDSFKLILYVDDV